MQLLFVSSLQWGPPRQQRLFGHFAHKWAPNMAGVVKPPLISSSPWGPLRRQGSFTRFGPKWAAMTSWVMFPLLISPHFGDPQDGRRYAAPSNILPTPRGPARWQRSRCHFAHVWDPPETIQHDQTFFPLNINGVTATPQRMVATTTAFY